MREKNQVVLPLDLGIRIPEGDFVFKVAEICESLDYTELFNTYLRSWRKVNPANGRKLKFRGEHTRVTENGYLITTRYYSNDKCGRFPHRDKCHKSKKDYRTIQVNNVILEHRSKTLEALTSEEGTLLRMNRSIQVEGVFGFVHFERLLNQFSA